jgi:hypothetical protein
MKDYKNGKLLTFKNGSTISLWCDICEKAKHSHDYLKGMPIHTRDDVPDGYIYMLELEYLGDKLTKG